VESPGKDRGSTFSLRLKTVAAPAVAGDGAEEAPTVSREKEIPKPSQRRVLVVDDHQDTCTGMKMMLERRGYEITVAYSAEQAVQKTHNQDFDLLISDIGLPGRNGYELMRELRESKGMPGIALTGFGSEHDISKARAAGFAKHLTKPINFEQLQEAIQSLLDHEPITKS
jgi:CheY-like chemotaxis protein